MRRVATFHTFADSSGSVSAPKTTASGLNRSQCDPFDIERAYSLALDLSMHFEEYIHVIKPDLKLGLKILQ